MAFSQTKMGYCMGRLEYTELSESAKQPILLPQKERFTYLLIDKVHRKILHSGVSQTLNEVRMTYWIPHGRAVVRSRIKECRICRRAEGGSNMLPNLAPLPKSLVTHSTPFPFYHFTLRKMHQHPKFVYAFSLTW